MRRLDRLYLSLFDQVQALRGEDTLGAHLQLPKLPNALSEGIAKCAAPLLIRDAADAGAPPGRHDLAVTTGRGIELIAVKGTSRTRWISITRTDVDADHLVWIDYSARVADHELPVDVWHFPNTRGRVVTGKLTFDQLCRLVPPAAGPLVWHLEAGC